MSSQQDNLGTTLREAGLDKGEPVFLLIDCSGGMPFPKDRLLALPAQLSDLTTINLVVVLFDMDVLLERAYSSETVNEIGRLEQLGGAGTLFEPAFRRVTKLSTQTPANVVIYTDGIDTAGYTPEPVAFNLTWVSEAKWIAFQPHLSGVTKRFSIPAF